MIKEHYIACVVAADKSWEARARRAGVLDGFHGYPRQEPEGKDHTETKAYLEGYAEGAAHRPPEAPPEYLRPIKARTFKPNKPGNPPWET